MKNKLKSKSGFTFVEVLISLTILTMSIALFSGITHSTHAVVSRQADYRSDMANQYKNLDSSMSSSSKSGEMAITLLQVKKSHSTNILDVNSLKNGGTLRTKSQYQWFTTLDNFMSLNRLIMVDVYTGKSADSSVQDIYAYKLNPEKKYVKHQYDNS